MKKPFLWLLIAGLAWRISLLSVGMLAETFFPYAPTFPYAYTMLPLYQLPQWLYSWANFDGVHYLTIIERGYHGTALIQAFFPAYPSLVGIVDTLVKNAIVSGLIISNLFFFGTLIAWFTLLEVEKLSPWVGVVVLLFFPSAFFLGALYSESLFIFLIVTSFLAARQKAWVVASILAGFASATRVVGIFLLPALVIEYLVQQLPNNELNFTFVSFRAAWRHWWQHLTLRDIQYLIGIIVVGSFGLLGYMTYLGQQFSDPLYFFHVQAEFGAGRSESLIPYPQVIWRYLKILATYQAWDWSYFTYLQEFIYGLFGFLGLLTALKYVRLSYVTFSLAAFLLPTLTGTFSSMSRYTLVCLALLLLLTKFLQSHRWRLAAYLVLSGILLIINTMLFIQGYWVA